MDLTKPNVFYTQDIGLAAALLCCGFMPVPKDPIERVFDDRKGDAVCYFYFENKTGIKDFYRAWKAPTDTYGDSSHELHSPDHPFWYMRAFHTNRAHLLDALKNRSPISRISNRDGKLIVFTQWPNPQN